MRRRELKYKCMDMDAWTITQCTLTLVKMAFHGWFKIPTNVWQSRVEIECYFIAYFDRYHV